MSSRAAGRCTARSYYLAAATRAGFPATQSSSSARETTRSRPGRTAVSLNGSPVGEDALEVGRSDEALRVDRVGESHAPLRLDSPVDAARGAVDTEAKGYDIALQERNAEENRKAAAREGRRQLITGLVS